MAERPPSWTPPGRVLVNLSGGLDSAYGAWQALERGIPLVLHHCELVNREGRAPAELRAVEGVLKWFQAQGLKHYTIYRSHFDYRTLPFVIYDVELIGWVTGMILRSPRLRDVGTVMVTANAEDHSVRKADSRRGRIRREAAEMAAYRKLDWWWPLRELTKAQMVERMPEELLRLTWWCRRPVDTYQPCGECQPCKQMELALSRRSA